MSRQVSVTFGWVPVEVCLDAIAFFDGEYDRPPHDGAFLDVANAYRRAIGQLERKPMYRTFTPPVEGSSFGPYGGGR
jgi:hypothetical protein